MYYVLMKKTTSTDAVLNTYMIACDTLKDARRKLNTRDKWGCEGVRIEKKINNKFVGI